MSSEDEAPKQTTKPAMSRFLRPAGDSDSSDDSESESDEESEMSEDQGKPLVKRSRFLHRDDDDDQDSSDEDGGKKVVKSARDKRVEEMEALGKSMDNALKINDWVAISNGGSYFPGV